MSILIWNSLPALLNVSGSRRGNLRELSLQLHSQPPLAAASLFVFYPFPLGPTASVTGTGARLSTLCLYVDFTMKYAGFSCHQRCLVTMATGWLAPKVWECSVHLLVSCSCLLKGYWGDSEDSFHVNNQLGGRDAFHLLCPVLRSYVPKPHDAHTVGHSAVLHPSYQCQGQEADGVWCPRPGRLEDI